MTVIGVDPGANGTGLAVIVTRAAGPLQLVGGRVGAPLTADLVESTTVRRPDGEPVTCPSPSYLTAVVDQLRDYVARHRPTLIAVEGVTAPNPHVNRANGNAVINTGPILAAAMVYGAVVSRGYGTRLVVVRPGRNGSRPLGTYPGALVSSAERRGAWTTRKAGPGALKDQRSAYDVAVAGHTAARTLPAHSTYAY